MRAFAGLSLVASAAAAEHGSVRASSLMQMKPVSMLSTLESTDTSQSLASASKYVEELAARAVGHNFTMDDTEREALYIVKGFLEGLFDHMNQETAADQQEADGIQSALQNCGLAYQEEYGGSAAGAEDAMKVVRNKHDTCRKSQLALYKTRVQKCGAYNSYRKSNTKAEPPSCIANEHLSKASVATNNPNRLEMMEACLEATEAWLKPLYQLYKACHDAKYEEHVQDLSCDQDQIGFEIGFCEFVGAQDAVCGSYNGCFDGTLHGRSIAYPALVTAEKARKADWKAAQKVLCLLNIFEFHDNEEKPQSLARCDSLTTPTSHLDIVYPEVPDRLECIKEAHRPCEAEWFSRYYESSVWSENAPADECQIKCPAI